MKFDLPRYVETPPGDAPDAYFIAGASVTPISRIQAMEVTPRSDRSRPFPPVLAALDNAIAAVASIGAQVEKIERIAVAVAEVDIRSFHGATIARPNHNILDPPTRLAVA